MNDNVLKAINSNRKLKRKIYSLGVWKNYAFIPPSLILFISIFGLIFLQQLGMFVSWYSLPFVILFLFGTIWLKGTKKYLVDQSLANADLMLCVAVLIEKKNKNSYYLFTTNCSKQKISLLEKEKQRILSKGKDFFDNLMRSFMGNLTIVIPDTDFRLLVKKRNKHLLLMDSICIIYDKKRDNYKIIPEKMLKNIV